MLIAELNHKETNTVNNIETINQTMSLKEYVLHLHSMTTSEFCKEQNISPPHWTGDVKTAAHTFTQIDAIKLRLITEYAKTHD